MIDCTALLPSDLLACGWRAVVVDGEYELSGPVMLPRSRRLPWLLNLARVWSELPTVRAIHMFRDDWYQFSIYTAMEEVSDG